jgi:beige protein homolog 1
VKRLLDAMKAETLSEVVLPHFMSAFENLVKCNSSAEVYRALALFITYAFHSPITSLPRTPKPLSALSRSSTPGLIRRVTTMHEDSGTSTPGMSKFLTKKQLGVKILGMYSGLLCERGNLVNIRKFARTVTNKVRLSDDKKPKEYVLSPHEWLLYLLAEDDAETVVYGAKILARLLVTHGSAYTSKFASKTGGFIIIAHRLKRWWDIPTLWPICFSILFGYDVAEIDFDRNFEFFSLVETFGKCKIVYPDAMPIITSMIKHGLKDVLRHQDDPNSPAQEAGSSQPVAAEGSGGRPRSKSMDLAKALESRRKFLPFDSDPDLQYLSSSGRNGRIYALGLGNLLCCY